MLDLPSGGRFPSANELRIPPFKLWNAAAPPSLQPRLVRQIISIRKLAYPVRKTCLRFHWVHEERALHRMETVDTEKIVAKESGDVDVKEL